MLFCFASQTSSSGISASAAMMETSWRPSLRGAGRSTGGAGMFASSSAASCSFAFRGSVGIADQLHFDGKFHALPFCIGREDLRTVLNPKGQAGAVGERETELFRARI